MSAAKIAVSLNIPLLTKSAGMRWVRDHQFRPIKAAVKRA